MAQTIAPTPSGATRVVTAHRAIVNPAEEAYWVLRAGFIIAPIIAGVDKFFYLLTNWSKYLAPQIATRLPITETAFMQAVGVIEVVAGVGVALMPRVFSWVVAAWLAAIIVNLVMVPYHYDIALRDLGLFMAAVALARLSVYHHHHHHRVGRLALD
jgi:hypothetical protein